jgi:enterochelin esterase-like enzyme/uncharacterized damage-inducible protein DinB
MTGQMPWPLLLCLMVSEIFDKATVTGSTQLLQKLLPSAFLGRDVELSILLPPSEFVLTAYPVLYLNDGQDLARLGLQATLDELYKKKAIEPFVVVAIYANAERVQEYGTAAQPDYDQRGSKAGAYSQFILQELLPFAQTTYKVSASPLEAVFAGFSLGGLSAFDIVWHHPEAFARAGAFSGSFWWRTRDLQGGYIPTDRIMHGLVRAGELHPSHQFWLQTGTLDEHTDRNQNGVIDSIEDCLDLMEELVKKGIDARQHIRYVQVEGGRHHPDTWGQVMPDFLQWAFGQAGAPALPAPLPMVRLQFDASLVPAPESTAVPATAAEADTLPATVFSVSEAAPDAPNVSLSDIPEHILTVEPALPMLDLFMPTTRPAAGDYLSYYEKYIDLVPVGADPREVLREQTSEVQTTFGALTEAQAQTAYAPEKWTIKQMLLHLIDAERIFCYRALRFARGDEQTLAGFDENEYAANSGANERTLSSLLAEYAANRAATLALVNSFIPEQLARKGTANGAAITVNALLYILPGHERHHLGIFRERYLPTL